MTAPFRFVLPCRSGAGQIKAARSPVRLPAMKRVLLPCLVRAVNLAQAEDPPARSEKTPTYFERIFRNGHGESRPHSSPVKRPDSNAEPWVLSRVAGLPPGEALTPVEAAKREPGDYQSKTIYLVGVFDVTARSQNRAVLRCGPGPTAAGATTVRVVAEFPADSPAPPEGKRLTVEQSNGWQITKAVPVGDGYTVNIAVRQITDKAE